MHAVSMKNRQTKHPSLLLFSCSWSFFKIRLRITFSSVPSLATPTWVVLTKHPQCFHNTLCIQLYRTYHIGIIDILFACLSPQLDCKFLSAKMLNSSLYPHCSSQWLSESWRIITGQYSAVLFSPVVLKVCLMDQTKSVSSGN